MKSKQLPFAIILLFLTTIIVGCVEPSTTLTINGKIAFGSDRGGESDIYVMDSDGSNLINVTNNSAADFMPVWSPDGNKIAFTSKRDSDDEIYIMDNGGSNLIKLTNNPASDSELTWSPDGNKIAFSSDRDGNYEIYIMDNDGSNPINLTYHPAYDRLPAWSPDGNKIAFTSDRDGNGEIYLMNVDGSKLINLTNNPADDIIPAWSPDGNKIAFTSDRDGNAEIYVMDADGNNPINLTNNSATDMMSAWSPDGNKIAFTSERDGNGEIYLMNVDGSNPINITNHPADDWRVAWSSNLVKSSIQSEDSHLTVIDSFIEEEMQKNQIPGLSVGIVEGNEVIYLRGFGKAGSDRQVTPQTSFIIGSMSKSFTALAVMQLVEAGRVELDVPAQQYIPWFRLANLEVSTQITVRHLLNHTSGIPNIAGMRELVGTGEKTIEQVVRGLNRYEFIDSPGMRFQYSNANFWVAGLVIEMVSGESYAEYVENNIYKQLDMKNSFTSQSEAKKHAMSEGYHRWFGFPVQTDVPYLLHSLPSGYIISCAEDMSHYLIAQMNNGIFKDTTVLSPEGIAELHKPTVKADTGDYGMGWLIEYKDGNPKILHHGSTANFHSTMLIEPDTNRGIVVLTNVGLFELWPVLPSEVIVEGIASLLRDQSPPDYGSSIGIRYLITDIVIALLTAFVILFFSLLPQWRSRVANNIPQSNFTLVRRVIIPIVVDITWPLTILIGFPMMTHTPSWSYWLGYEPDLTYWLITLASLTLVKAVVRIWLSYPVLSVAFRSLNRYIPVMLIFTGEVIFLLLFFLVMFVSINPAQFVAVVLIIALLLEVISFPVRLLGRPKQVGLTA